MSPEFVGQSRRLLLPGRFIGRYVLLSWLLSGSLLAAAESPKTPGETKQAAPAAVAIADSEIIPRADQTVKSLQKLRFEVAGDSTLNAIQRDFAAFAETSNCRRESEAEMMSKSRSVQRLNEIMREWGLEQSQLNDWDQALAKKFLFKQFCSVSNFVFSSWTTARAA